MYTYPEYLNAGQRVAIDLFSRAHEKDPVRFPFSPKQVTVTVVADSVTGTASVDWRPSGMGMSWQHLYVTINMPVKAATYRVTEAEFQHGIAYLLHECGHPWHTDKAVWDAAVARRAQRMLNFTDDVRQEKATIDLGLAVNATKMFGSLIDSLHAKAVAGGYDPNDLRSFGWTLSLLGRQANGYGMDVSDVTRRLDPKGQAAAILEWALPALKACVTTQDCMDLSDRVTDAIRAASRPQPQPEPEIVLPEPETGDESEIEVEAEDLFPESDDGENPTEVEEGDEPEQEFQPQGTQKGEGKAEGENTVNDNATADRRNDLNDEEDKPEPEEDLMPEPEPEPEPDADDLVDEVDMTPNRNEVVTSSSGASYSATRQVIRQVRKALETPKGDKPIAGRTTRYGYKGLTTVDIVTGDASKMGRQRSLLAAALKREESDDYEGGRLHGRLDRRAMARLVTGNPHVFGKRTVTEGYDTDVQVLIDGSTSMDNDRIMAAATLGLVVAQAAAQVGVECSAHVFNDGGLHAITKGRAKPLGRRFAYAYNQVCGCTPLTENMLAVAFEQKRRAPHKRRILFLITDGGCDLGPDVLKGAGQYVENVIGAEIANLHIGYKPMGIFRNECAVNVDNVPASGLQTLTGVLERGRS